jgi:hypothetical protein
MSKLKTLKNKSSVPKFISAIEHEQQMKDCKELLNIFKEATGMKPFMWGTSIVGYGSYHYKSERSTQEGDWPLTGFSPRKGQISVYIMPGFQKYGTILKKLGKHKTSTGSCLYIKKLSDVDTKVLTALITRSVTDMKKSHTTSN